MQGNPLVSIVIPSYNRKKSTERLIRSLIVSAYKNLEIIVIDDASKDQTSEYLKSKFKTNKKIKIFRNKKNMFAAASKNEGKKRAKGKFVMFIDDDNVVEKYMISELLIAFKLFPDAGEVVPLNYDYNNKKKLLLTRSTRSMWTTKTSQLRTLSPFGSKKYWECDDAPNAYMVRGDVVRKNKINFWPKFGIMYEESDFAYKIKKAGYKVLMVKDAKVYHDIEERSSDKLKKDYMFHFMDDKRRPFLFARNRIIFHSIYSTKIQVFFILIFWIWFFSFYYIYKFIFYKGYGDFSFMNRTSAAFSYLKGTINGLKLVFSGKLIT